MSKIGTHTHHTLISNYYISKSQIVSFSSRVQLIDLITERYDLTLCLKLPLSKPGALFFLSTTQIYNLHGLESKFLPLQHILIALNHI